MITTCTQTARQQHQNIKDEYVLKSLKTPRKPKVVGLDAPVGEIERRSRAHNTTNEPRERQKQAEGQRNKQHHDIGEEIDDEVENNAVPDMRRRLLDLVAPGQDGICSIDRQRRTKPGERSANLTTNRGKQRGEPQTGPAAGEAMDGDAGESEGAWGFRKSETTPALDVSRPALGTLNPAGQPRGGRRFRAGVRFETNLLGGLFLSSP